MSAQMKLFIDRLTDLIIQKKNDILKSKSMYILTTYAGSETEQFEKPFQLTANYMFMSYRGCLYISNNEKENIINQKIIAFKNRIERNAIYIDQNYQLYT